MDMVRVCLTCGTLIPEGACCEQPQVVHLVTAQAEILAQQPSRVARREAWRQQRAQEARRSQTRRRLAMVGWGALALFLAYTAYVTYILYVTLRAAQD